jgi:hypothetical protein
VGPKYSMVDLKKKLLELCKSCARVVKKILLIWIWVDLYSFSVRGENANKCIWVDLNLIGQFGVPSICFVALL